MQFFTESFKQGLQQSAWSLGLNRNEMKIIGLSDGWNVNSIEKKTQKFKAVRDTIEVINDGQDVME